MPYPAPCLPACSSTPVVTNIPGPAGQDGLPGPIGPQGPAATLSTVSVYGSGTAYSLTTVSQLVAMGTTSPSITLAAAGTYELHARVSLDYNGATFGSNELVTVKLRCTNNTISDVANASASFNVAVITTLTYTAGIIPIPPVAYVATAGDVIQIWAAIAATPSAGSIQITQCEIFAVKIA
jgi:hypothetical protein